MNPANNGRIEAAIRRIEKLSRLSTSSEPNEAAAALRQMQKLMQEYNLTKSDIELSTVRESPVVSKAKNPANYEKGLVQTIENAFGVNAILFINRWMKTTHWHFIGVGSTPELAGYAFTVLRRQVKKNRAIYIKTKLSRCKKAKTKTARADAYCEAYVYALYEKVTKFANSETNQAILARYMEARYTQIQTMANRNVTVATRNANDEINGYRDGKQAELFHAMDGQPEQLRLA